MHEPYDNALLTPAEMGAADRAATALGVSGVQLMEAAGRAVAGNVQGHWPRQQIVVGLAIMAVMVSLLLAILPRLAGLCG